MQNEVRERKILDFLLSKSAVIKRISPHENAGRSAFFNAQTEIGSFFIKQVQSEEEVQIELQNTQLLWSRGIVVSQPMATMHVEPDSNEATKFEPGEYIVYRDLTKSEVKAVYSLNNLAQLQSEKFKGLVSQVSEEDKEKIVQYLLKCCMQAAGVMEDKEPFYIKANAYFVRVYEETGTVRMQVIVGDRGSGEIDQPNSRDIDLRNQIPALKLNIMMANYFLEVVLNRKINQQMVKAYVKKHAGVFTISNEHIDEIINAIEFTWDPRANRI